MSYERYERRTRRQQTGRDTFSYWVPLALTVTVATFSLAAWIWSERSSNDDDNDNEGDRRGPVEGADDRPQRAYDEARRGDSSFASGAEPAGPEDPFGNVVARMSGALRRTPSPQQILDGASRRVAAGIAAAGAAVGGALSSIQEEDRDDQRPVHAETDTSRTVPASKEPSTSVRAADIESSSGTTRKYKHDSKRKTVALVVSAETITDGHRDGSEYEHEDASLLSHLSAHVDHATTRLFVLIYAPELKHHPSFTGAAARASGSMTSSFSEIARDEAHTPADEMDRPLAAIDPRPMTDEISPPAKGAASEIAASGSPLLRTLCSQARHLVEKDSMILFFTTSAGHVHILRHLGPHTVYMQDSLSGNDGDVVANLSGWVGQVVIVVGAEGGHGFLVDSDDEGKHQDEGARKWWEKGERVGLGKGVDVVEGVHIGEDWARRVRGLE